MNKNTVIIIIIIIMIVLSSTGFYLYKQGYFSKDEPGEELIINKEMIFLVSDYDTGESISSDYKVYKEIEVEKCLNEAIFLIYKKDKILFYKSFPEYKGKEINDEGCYVDSIKLDLYNEGEFVEGNNKITVEENSNYQMFLDSDNYYSVKYILQYKLIEESETNYIKLKKKENNLTFDLWGEIREKTTTNNRLVLYGDDYYKLSMICLNWDFGIISVTSSSKEVEFVPPMEDHVEKCYKYNPEAIENGMQFDFNIKTREINTFDNIYFYILDSDIDFNDFKHKEYSESGDDLGSINYKLTYNLENNTKIIQAYKN